MPEQSEAGNADSQSGKGDVDAGCSLVIIVQFFNFIFDEGVIELPLTHYFVV